MRILHYSLGFPPFRRGGLTKYCIDLMTEQKKMGNSVAMLWPGEMGIIRQKKTKIVHHKPYINKKIEIDSFELCGCLPVPLLEGISSPNEYIKDLDIEVFKKFINCYLPDVVHFHTLMGFPKNYLKYLNERKIKTVFTSHDYYGICPRTTLIKGKSNCLDYNCENCGNCNKNAITVKKIRILQSKVYRIFKDSSVIKRFRKMHWAKNEQLVENYTESATCSINIQTDYRNLRKYYITMLEMFDVVHFNSSNTQAIYDNFSYSIKGKVLNISHADIKDNRLRRARHDVCCITYLGPNTYHKGYYLLLNVCDELWKAGYRFKINIYFRPTEEKEYLSWHEPYVYGELESIMKDTDFLVVPSLWNETYGFTVLEAMAFGIPAIVSKTVGAKDEIIHGSNGIIVDATKEDLYNAIKRVIEDEEIFDLFNLNICKYYNPRLLSTHCKEMLDLYRGSYG